MEWGWVGVENVEKMTHPFLGSKIINVLVFFYFEPKKCFLVYGAECNECLCGLCTF